MLPVQLSAESAVCTIQTPVTDIGASHIAVSIMSSLSCSLYCQQCCRGHGVNLVLVLPEGETGTSYKPAYSLLIQMNHC